VVLRLLCLVKRGVEEPVTRVFVRMFNQVALCQGLPHIAEPNDVIASFQRQLTAALPEGQVPLVLEVHEGLLAVLGQRVSGSALEYPLHVLQGEQLSPLPRGFGGRFLVLSFRFDRLGWLFVRLLGGVQVG